MRVFLQNKIFKSVLFLHELVTRHPAYCPFSSFLKMRFSTKKDLYSKFASFHIFNFVRKIAFLKIITIF